MSPLLITFIYQMTTSIAIVALGGYIFYKSKRRTEYIWLCLLTTIALGLTIFFGTALDLYVYFTGKPLLALIILYTAANSFVNPVFIHFCAVFPVQYPGFDRRIIYFSYIPGIYLFIVSLFNQYVATVTVQNHQLIKTFTYNYMVDAAFTLYMCIISIFIVVNKLKKIENQIHKRQIRTLLVGCAFGCCIGFIGFILLYFNLKLPVYETGVLVGVLVLSYSIVRYQAFDFKTTLHRFLLYIVSNALLFLPIILVPFLFFPFFKSHVSALIACGIGATLLAIAYERFVAPAIKRFALRRQHIFRDEVKKLTDTLLHLDDMKSMNLAVFQSVTANIYAEDTVMIIGGDNGGDGCFHVSGEKLAINAESWRTMKDADTDIIDESAIRKTPVIAHLRDSLALLVKLNTPTEQIGFIGIAEKKNGKKYSVEEMRFLIDIAGRAAPVVRTIQESEKRNRVIREIVHEIKNTSSALEYSLNDFIAGRDFDAAASRQLNDIVKEMNKLHLFSRMHLTYEVIDKLDRIDSRYINLHELVDESRRSYQSQLKAKNIDCVITIPHGVQILGNEYLLSIVFANIITNAVRHVGGSGRITVSTADADGCLKLMFSDDGSGMPADIMATLFDAAPVQRPHQSNSFGIGMPLSKKILTKHSATITVASAVNEGTTFTIVFPKESVLNA